MQVFGILDRYIGRTIFTTSTMSLFILVSLSGVIKFVDQLKKSGQGSYDAIGAWIYTVLTAPKDIQIFFPMAGLLGTLLGLGILAQRSELIVMQASGYTRMQVALSVIKITIPLVFFSMVIGEWVAPQGEQMASTYRSRAMYGGSLVATKQGVWAKDGKNFVYIEHIKSNDELSGVNIYTFNKNHSLQSMRYAVTAKFDAKHNLWRLSQVNESNFQNPKQITGSKIVSSIWKTNLTPDKLRVVVLDLDSLSISGLLNYIKYLESNGQDASRYQFNMWNKIFQPILITVMMLMALSCIFGPLRKVSMGIRVVAGIGFGFFFYVLSQILGPLTLVYGIPPIIGALLPSASFFSISLWLLLKHS